MLRIHESRVHVAIRKTSVFASFVRCHSATAEETMFLHHTRVATLPVYKYEVAGRVVLHRVVCQERKLNTSKFLHPAGNPSFCSPAHYSLYML